MNIARRCFSVLTASQNWRASLPKTIKESLSEEINSDIIVNGWIQSIRRHKKVVFASLNDGSGNFDLQLVMSPRDAESLEVGSSVKVRGILTESIGKGQSKEVQVQELSVLGRCHGAEYPIQKQELSAEYLRNIPHLRPRTSNFSSILRLRSRLASEVRNFLNLQNFHEVHAPCISFSDCEGGGEAFNLKDGDNIFGKNTYLTVSAQLHAEVASAGLGRVFTFGPVFRAEKHHTSRHLAEFTMLEVEIAFIDSNEILMNFAEELIRGALGRLGEEFPNLNYQKVDHMLSRPFERISYEEAVKFLQRSEENGKARFVHPIKYGLSLQSEHEKYLAAQVSNGPIFVHDYPAPLKAFYMKQNDVISYEKPWENSTVACFDLLVPEVGELMGGSLREERLDNLEKSIERFKLDRGIYDWYLDLRRFGSVPHGGFGLGFDRLLQYLTDTPNIRDVVLIPRAAGSSLC